MNKFFEALSRNVVATVLLVLAVIFIGYKLATMGPQAAGLAVVAIACTVFVLAYLVAALDAHKAELAKLLKPRCGSGSTSDSNDYHSAKAHRQRLESDAMQALAYRALDMSDPVDAGNRMRQAIDAMLGAVSVSNCTSCQPASHSVDCLYEYALNRLGLVDTPEMRVLFWDAHGALTWNAETDHWVAPKFDPAHCKTCADARKERVVARCKTSPHSDNHAG